MMRQGDSCLDVEITWYSDSVCEDRNRLSDSAFNASVTTVDVEFFFFFSSRRRHTRFDCDWSSDVCSSDLVQDLADRDEDERGDDATGREDDGGGRAHPKRGPGHLVGREPEGDVQESRSEERRVGKEGRSRWSPYH